MSAPDNSLQALHLYLRNAALQAVDHLRLLARDGDQRAVEELRRYGISAPPLSLLGLQRVAASMPASLDDEIEEQARRRQAADQASVHHFPITKRSPSK